MPDRYATPPAAAIAAAPGRTAPAFTPGPWRVEYDDNGFYHLQAEGRPSPYIAATGGEGEMDKANMILASAAPEMFEALQEAVAELAEYTGIIINGQKDERGSRIVSKARAALTKATGGQS